MISGSLSRNDTELLHHAHVVADAPVLHSLAIGDPNYVDLRHGEPFVCGGGFP